jgi:alpha-D-ribose 1-methylphosphonate 5-triphosphate diphosphatase
MYAITNGRIVTEETILDGFDLLIRGDRIEAILPTGQLEPTAGVEMVDAAGGYVSPGFIDLHSDYIEHMAAPRPTSLMNFRLALMEAEKELIAHGITTMYHSLGMYNHTEYGHKPIRDRENVRRFADLIQEMHHSLHLVRHRFHARFEIDNLAEVDSLKAYLMEEKVHLLSFMDHTPGQGQYRDLEVYGRTVKGYHNVSDEVVQTYIDRHKQKEMLTIDGIRELAELAQQRGIAIASHDDDSLEKLDLVHGFGATISEFPITLEIACKAKELGMHTMAGAPNVLLGGSHSGNLSAPEAIQKECIDILCSDYYPAAMIHAIFELHTKYGMDLVDMFKLVTINPARAIKLDDELGSIRAGKKADLLIIEMIDLDFPVVTGVFVDGKLIQRTNYRI